MLGGRCVGGGTTVNTKVALRAHPKDLAKWHAASGLVGAAARLRGVRPRAALRPRRGAPRRARADDWPRSVYTVDQGFRALGSSSSR